MENDDGGVLTDKTETTNNHTNEKEGGRVLNDKDTGEVLNNEHNNNTTTQPSAEIDIEKVRGDSFWDILEESSSHTLQLQDPLKEILTTMGYDNVRSLQSFCDENMKQVEQFMRTKLHRILEKKFVNLSEDLKQKEMAKYYGPLFSFLPEEYEILGGQRNTILEASAVARNLLEEANKKKTQVASVFKKCFAPSKLAATEKLKPSDSSSNYDNILTETEILTNNIQKWFERNASNLLNVNEEGEIDYDSPTIVPRVVKNPLGGLIASVTCVVCSQNFKISKIGTRWSPSNFYRHVENVHQKKKRKQTDPGQQTLSTMFKSSTTDSEGGSVDSGKGTNTNPTAYDIGVVPAKIQSKSGNFSSDQNFV